MNKMLCYVIPENTGTVAIVFIEDGEPARYPVIAWQIEVEPQAVDTHNPIGSAFVTPICCDSLEGDIYCLELRDGGRPYSWVFQAECEFERYSEAIAYGEKQIAANKQLRLRREAFRKSASGPVQ